MGALRWKIYKGNARAKSFTYKFEKIGGRKII